MTPAPWRRWSMDPPSRALYRRVEMLEAGRRPDPAERGEIRLLLDVLHANLDLTWAWWRPVGPFS